MKLKQSETVVVKRSQLNFAAYNPRKKNKQVVEALKKNFKKVGFLGGIQWNSLSGNIIGGHKRLEALDLIFDYDGSAEKDYEVKVEKIELDEKTEKEQNIFLNNKRVQGETDLELMAFLVPEIDINNAGLMEYDMNLIEAMVPNFSFGHNEEIKDDIKAIKETRQQIKEKKKKQKKDFGDDQLQTHFTVTFKTYAEKAEYLEGIGINGDTIFITSREFLNKLQD